MIGVITLHPAKSNAFALLSSSVAIWVANVLTFSMLYWQIDRGGPYARASQVGVTPGLALSASREPPRTSRPTGGPCSSIISFLDTTRPRHSVPPMSCR